MVATTSNSPPDAAGAPAGAPDTNALDKRFNSDHDHTNRVGRYSATAAYVAGRQRTLGRLTLHHEAALAAGMLAAALGPLGARAWCRELLAALEEHR